MVCLVLGGSGIKRGSLGNAGSHILPSVSLFVCCYNTTLMNNDHQECVGENAFLWPEKVQMPAVQRALTTGACRGFFEGVAQWWLQIQPWAFKG